MFYINAFLTTDVCTCERAVPPEMSVSHDEYTVIVDNPILMSCEVTGIPAPRITWTTQGEDVADVKDVSTFRVLANGALRIDHVTTEDSGMYECVATNVAGNATMAVTLNVQGTLRLSFVFCILHFRILRVTLCYAVITSLPRSGRDH